MKPQQIIYDDSAARMFITASIIFGIVGMLVGVIIAAQMAFWQANFDTSWLQFGRLRPLHTNAVIFAFVGNMMFAGVYYSTQRLLKTRMASDLLSKIHFWGWQLIIVLAAITLPLGLTSGKEYAELEWPIDILIAVIWVVFAVNFFWTLANRNEKNLYVALWFYISCIVTVAVLHIVNSLALPMSLTKSYSIYSGVQDALVQWWYGHNAVAFFLTTPILGIMYYFLPKAIGKPVYSYRLSIIHFWALVFLYIWAGPHHLLNSALPDWAQNLGMVFSVALWAPSWGGMINGLLTLRGAWDKLRTDPVVKFFVAALTFYGMATFEGPLLSIKSVNALAHNTDWIIGHVHGAALGWNGFMAAGMFYWMVPRLFNTKLWSEKLANFHFWVGTLGIIMYMVAMYVSGITQGLMWKALTSEGTLLYPNFSESIFASQNMYVLRMAGGLLFLLTFILMAYNLWMTARSGEAVDGTTIVTVEDQKILAAKDPISAGKLVLSPTILLVVAGLGLLLTLGTQSRTLGAALLVGVVLFAVVVKLAAARAVSSYQGKSWHAILEGKATLFSVFVVLAALVGGMVQILPTALTDTAIPMEKQPTLYTSLELAGRDIYIREGCSYCHTQMVRPMVDESLRYGKPSKSWEFKYEHPHLWGSKRTGPDLHRIGKKYPNLWHYRHMKDPRSISQGSLMPNYAFLENNTEDFDRLPKLLDTMHRLGVPYTRSQINNASFDAQLQAKAIAADLKLAGEDAAFDTEMISLIAYLQKLGIVNPKE